MSDQWALNRLIARPMGVTALTSKNRKSNPLFGAFSPRNVKLAKRFNDRPSYKSFSNTAVPWCC